MMMELEYNQSILDNHVSSFSMILYDVTMTTVIANHKYYVVCRELGDQVIQKLYHNHVIT